MLNNVASDILVLCNYCTLVHTCTNLHYITQRFEYYQGKPKGLHSQTRKSNRRNKRHSILYEYIRRQKIPLSIFLKKNNALIIYLSLAMSGKSPNLRIDAVLEVLSDEGRPLASLMWLNRALKKL